MRCILAALLLLLLLQPSPPPPFTAVWQRPGVARLAWSQPSGTTRACLTRVPHGGQSVPLDCYDDIPPGPVAILLGATAPVDGNARSQAGDTFVLDIGDTRARAQLRGVVYLGVVRK